jgi:hypothetical protein
VVTDAEINLAIARIEYPDLTVESHGEAYIYFWGGTVEIVDYCKNWSDIGPIIEREKIKLFSSEGVDWKATLVKPCSELGYRVWTKEAKTPTRAAALCYLKMKEVYW